jgi:hypothetical protein
MPPLTRHGTGANPRKHVLACDYIIAYRRTLSNEKFDMSLLTTSAGKVTGVRGRQAPDNAPPTPP